MNGVVDPGDLSSDDMLLDWLGRALKPPQTGPPTDAVELAKSAPRHAAVDAELAELLYDSLLDAEPVAMRAASGTEHRYLSFAAADGGRLEIEFLATEPVLVGQLLPPRVARIDVQTAVQSHSIRADELGRLRCAIDDGPIRLRVVETGRMDLVTPWITR